MVISDVKLYSDEMRRTREALIKLTQCTEDLEFIHSRLGAVYGEPFPVCFTITLQCSVEKERDIKLNVSEPKEFSNEWRPAEEKDSEPSQAGDIFSLGCYFYSVITGGQHPFGKPGHRALFIANNLYDLSECRDEQLKKLIARMISHDRTQRPNSSDLLNHPYLWKEERVENYLMKLAENLDESNEKYQVWKHTVLFSSSGQSSDSDTIQKTSIVKTVVEILMEIKEKKETALDACRLFPDLLFSVYLAKNPDVIPGKKGDSLPETFGNVLIANDCFKEVPLKIGIKRRYGRFGSQPVHVMQFSIFTADSISFIKRLSCLKHRNLLRYFYLAENPDKNLVLACEPFDETLDNWMAKNSQSINFETAKEILTQITTEKDCTKNPSSMIQNDIRKLGQIYADLLQQTLDVPLCSDHLIQSMQDERDECVPPSEAILYHPFFWLSEESADFLLVAGDFYKENPNIDRNSRLITVTSPASERQHLKTNRSAIEYFLSHVTSESTTEELISLAMDLLNDCPTLITQTWLRLQKFKSADDESELPNFYPPLYDFPTYERLRDGTQENMNMQIALLGKEQYEDFVIEQFQKSNELGNQVPHGTQSYLDNYLQKWKLAIKDYGTTRTVMKHPAIDPFGRTAMHLACHSDAFYESASKLLKFGFNPNIPDSNGFVPLHVAALNNSFKIAKLLIENEAIIDFCENKELKTPLFFAAFSNSVLIVDLLMKMSADANKVDACGQSPLHIAVDINSEEVTELLLKNGANVNAVDNEKNCPLHIAVFKESLLMVKLLLDARADPNLANSQGQTPLHVAAHLKATCPIRLQMVNLLIDKGAKVNAVDNWGRTPLHVATFNAAEEVVEKLLECPCIEINVKDSLRGITPLHLAAWYGHGNIAQLLIKKEARVNVEDKNRQTPLEYAASSNSVNVAKQLLKAGAVAKSRNHQKSYRSPLHIAAAHGAREVAELLIKEGADVCAKDEFELTPLHYAGYRNQKDFIQFIKNSRNEKDKNSRNEKDFPDAISPMSKQLSPGDMADIYELANSFERKSMTLPGIEVSLSSFKNPVASITVAYQQVLMY
ncbi:putative Ankyrin repeat domain-containing protein 61 [Daphnia magna]|uniref:Putative Ankyrin repeat domain-containing protein 61 n=1 Tax=Daphnia magna TaxID=35525 RepID=A0A164KW61_9CRUS|nr:putative Ankyrin repeat domain-containing protein 61 [Daphnia magna]